jgi:hypothetical protein
MACVLCLPSTYVVCLILCVSRHLRHPLSESLVHTLVAEAVELEREFICEALQVCAHSAVYS